MPVPDDGPALEGLWIAQIARGDRAAFERLYGAYQRPLFRYFLHFVHTTETAEELTDDVLVEVWKNASRFHGRSKPSVWVFGIAYHKAMDVLRRRKPPVVDLHAIESVPDEQRPAPETAAIRESVRGEVAAALATLSAEHRAVLVLTFGHGYGYAEIAQIVGCPVNTVKTRMFYAKKRLKETLERRGLRADVS